MEALRENVKTSESTCRVLVLLTADRAKLKHCFLIANAVCTAVPCICMYLLNCYDFEALPFSILLYCCCSSLTFQSESIEQKSLALIVLFWLIKTFTHSLALTLLFNLRCCSFYLKNAIQFAWSCKL